MIRVLTAEESQQNWNKEKEDIAEKLGDITQIWYCGIKNRQKALEKNILSWRDKRCNSKNLGMGGIRGEIIDKIITILDLGNKNIYTLYELDNNLEIQTKIMDLIPEIRKWFSFNNMKSVGEPERIKRPWLSIIKHLTKTKYTLESKSFHFKNKEKWVMTQQYIFTNV